MNSAETFDPVSELLVAQRSKPEELSPINLRTLTPFQRALLVIDGTVTKFIEAYTMEPIDTVRLHQETRPLSQDHHWLGAPAGTIVIARQVLLRGKYSYTVFAYAASLIVPDRMPETSHGELEQQGGSLGRILLAGELETRREVLWYGKGHSNQLPDDVSRTIGQEFISRTYRIIAGGQPVMVINENFPYDTDERLSPQ